MLSFEGRWLDEDLKLSPLSLLSLFLCTAFVSLFPFPQLTGVSDLHRNFPFPSRLKMAILHFFFFLFPLPVTVWIWFDLRWMLQDSAQWAAAAESDSCCQTRFRFSFRAAPCSWHRFNISLRQWFEIIWGCCCCHSCSLESGALGTEPLSQFGSSLLVSHHG